MQTGTSHFESFGAAVKYYLPYLGDNDLSGAAHLRGTPEGTARTHRLNSLRCEEWVRSKLDAGEIHIGAPKLKAGERLSIHKEERRYFVTSP